MHGLGLDGEYQFDPGAAVPALINLSKLSTEAGYGEPLTPSRLLKTIAADAELPRPAHLDALGPIGPRRGSATARCFARDHAADAR